MVSVCWQVLPSRKANCPRLVSCGSSDARRYGNSRLWPDRTPGQTGAVTPPTNSGAEARAAASRLSGPAYAHSNQRAATRDDQVAGRWVAVDESGWDGEQLYGRADRYLSIGSVAVDDESASTIVERLRRETALTQPPELKFGQFASQKGGKRLEALAALLEREGALAGRAHVYLVDKHYFVTGKIIDLLLEEHAFERGINLYEGGRARALAWTLFHEGPSALGSEGFDRLIATMVGFASMRNRDGSVVSIDKLFTEIDRAWSGSRRWRVTEILCALRWTQAEAEGFLQMLKKPAYELPAMEPLIPCIPRGRPPLVTGGRWYECACRRTSGADRHHAGLHLQGRGLRYSTGRAGQGRPEEAMGKGRACSRTRSLTRPSIHPSNLQI
jgi:hypothetical protein